MGRHYLDHASTSPLRPEALAAMTTWLEASARGEVGRSQPAPPRGHDAPGSRWRRPASRWPRCSGPEPGRWCSPAAPPRPSPPRCGVRPSGAESSWCRRSSTRRCADRARRSPRSADGPPGWSGWASIGWVGSTPTRSWPRPRPGRGWCTSSGATTRWAPSSRWPRSSAGAAPPGVLVHVDAAQAAGRVPIAFDELGADLLSVSGPQVRRAARHRRPARAARAPPASPAHRRRPGAGPAGRDGERPRPDGAGRGGRGPGRRCPAGRRSGRRPGA